MAKILVIEDEEAARDSIRRTLEKNRHEVIVAANGKKGLEMIELGAPDLIITDLFMPDMDGLETIRNVAKSKPNIPVIAFTGSLEPHFLQAARSFGAVDGLRKPFDEEELLSAVGKALEPGLVLKV